MEMTIGGTTMNAPAIYPLLLPFRLNHRLFLNSLEGVTDEQAAERISPHSNPLIWIATHTVWARYNILAVLGRPAENPFAGMFENFRAFDAGDVYPSVEKVIEEWKKVSALMKVALHEVTEEHITSEAPFKNPIGDFSVAGTLAFFAQHESYDIGQMGFLKK